MAACSVALARVDSLGVSERWPLDACALTGHCRPLLVRIPSRSVCFVFWALPSSSSRLVLPPWVSRLGVQDEDAAEVDELSSGEIQELEGPLTTPDRIQACVLFGHSGLKEAMRRQLERLPGSPPSASGAMEWHVALRLMGEVYIFKARKESAGGRGVHLDGPKDGVFARNRPNGWETWPRAAAADAADAAASTAAEKCKAGPPPELAEVRAPSFRAVARRSAVESARKVARVATSCCLSCPLSRALGGEVIFVPLVELLWEMPRGIRPPMMGQLLWNLVQQMGLDEDEQGLLFLGSLDGPLPEYPELASHLWPLKGLRRCYVVGTCSSKEHVHPKLLELFHENLVELPSLGFGPARVAAPPRTVVQYFTSVETFRAMGVQWPPRTLLHGPSGSGKTQLLRWLADRVAPYAEVTWLRPAEVFSRYLGESEERLRNAFAAVQNKEAAVLILEGLD
ncbi:ATPase family protein 2 homolog (Spermatogenesis-associated factor protein) (Spermatogenesis-associated protein 5), partial [Durusdinium trenchii]